MAQTMRKSPVMKKKKAPMKAMSMQKSPARAMEKMKSSSLQLRKMKKKKKKTGGKNKMSGSSKFQ